MSKKRLLLIDGHSLAYRAFYALPVENFATSTGQHTNAVYGMASMLINLISSEKPSHIAAAFDVSRKTFRSEKFPDYKANRSATPIEFKSQAEYLFRLMDAFAIKRFTQEGFEADDLIASISTQATKADFEVLICTGDRDSFQLVTKEVTVLYPRKGVTDLARMTPESVQEKYGLTPSQYPDFAALRGDPSDNLPSIPGVGEKTAAKWINEYGSLDKLLVRAADIPGKAGESLRSHIDSIKLNHELTHLKRDLEVIADIEELKWSQINLAQTSSLFEELEIKALKERLKSLSGDAQKPETKKVASPRNFISPEELSAKVEGPIYLSVNIDETRILGYQVMLQDSKTYSVQGGEFGDWLNDPKISKTGHGLKRIARIKEVSGISFDTELAAYLINPGSRSLSLEDLSEKYLGISNETDELFSESSDETLTALMKLVPILTSELKERGLEKLFFEMELPILNLLAQMERTGIAIDREGLSADAKFLELEVERETQAAHKLVGREFNVNSPKQLQVVLFDDLKLPKTKKIKTGYTTDAESLEWLYQKSKHPFLQHLLRIRETSKLLSVVDGLITSISKDGRIHTEFQQTIAATGRLSSINPNLQNIPIRTQEGRKIRSHFVAQSPYSVLLTADYSQIELRIMAHLSKDQALISAFQSGEDLHSTMASLVFGVTPSEVDPEMRRKIKAMSYGLAYGLSSFGLSAQLDISPAEANVLMDKYMERFGGIQDYLKKVVAEARKVGYTETIFGRRRYLPDLNQDNRVRRENAERAALNAPMQGSAADIIKIAMLSVQAKIEAAKLKSRLLLQVHDELIFECMESELEQMREIVKAAMSGAAKLSIPLDVNIGIGRTWDEAAH